tara:strand:+ start:4392 stop:4667 length:276 start_codon:yes stop_codon:yes gene_type:complete
MPIDGGRLNAHKARTEDFRRRKDGKLKSSETLRSTSNQKIDFDPVDPVELQKIKDSIRLKSKKRKRTNVVLLLFSLVAAVLLFFLFTEKYS